jgi:DNA/RNA-binding domain of Phe-tRNA-synthetase-like protein
MRFWIEPEVHDLFPSLSIGILTLKDVRNDESRSELAALKDARMAEIRCQLSLQELDGHPHLKAWREAYRRFGTSPKKHRPTAESLLRRVLQGKGLPSISPLVDLYLLTSVECVLPIGGYDLDNIDGDIVLRVSPGREPFAPLDGEEREETYAGEIVYADASKILTRRWNHRDGDLAKIRGTSDTVALFCESPSSGVPPETIQACLDRLAAYARRFCQCRTSDQTVKGRSGPVDIL